MVADNNMMKTISQSPSEWAWKPTIVKFPGNLYTRKEVRAFLKIHNPKFDPWVLSKELSWGIQQARRPSTYKEWSSIFLLTLPYWYTCSARPHRAASGAHSWRAPRGGTNKCTASGGSLRTYWPYGFIVTCVHFAPRNYFLCWLLVLVVKGPFKSYFANQNLLTQWCPII